MSVPLGADLAAPGARRAVPLAGRPHRGRPKGTSSSRPAENTGPLGYDASLLPFGPEGRLGPPLCRPTRLGWVRCPGAPRRRPGAPRPTGPTRRPLQKLTSIEQKRLGLEPDFAPFRAPGSRVGPCAVRAPGPVLPFAFWAPFVRAPPARALRAPCLFLAPALSPLFLLLGPAFGAPLGAWAGVSPPGFHYWFRA